MQGALAAYRGALEVHEGLQSPPRRGKHLDDIGDVYLYQGDDLQMAHPLELDMTKRLGKKLRLDSIPPVE